jgi:hypothetical protein
MSISARFHLRTEVYLFGTLWLLVVYKIYFEYTAVNMDSWWTKIGTWIVFSPATSVVPCHLAFHHSPVLIFTSLTIDAM